MSEAWDFRGATYILSDAQATEVNTYSEAEPDDAKFNAWFADYVVKNKVQVRTYGRAKYWSRLPESTDPLNRLVEVKKSATTLMRTIDPKIASSDIEFDKGAYPIPSKPAQEAHSLHEAIDATAGYAIHSAFKQKYANLSKTDSLRYSEPPKDDANYSQRMLKHQIFELIETMRANYGGLKDNPGFTGYIESLIDDLYNGYVIPDDWPEESGEQLAALVAPALYGDRVGDPTARPYREKALKALGALDKAVTANPDEKLKQRTLDEAINTIYSLLDIDKSEPPEDSNAPVAMGLEGESDTTLSDVDRETIDSRIELGQELVEANPTPEGPDAVEPVTILKIRPAIYPTGQTIKKASGQVAKVDAALRLRKTLARNITPYQRSGDLDEDELYRLMQGDDRVFLDIEEEQEESASIHFLIDASGSMMAGLTMFDTRVEAAAQLAWLFAHSMNKRPHVKAHVWAHTGDGMVFEGKPYTAWGRSDFTRRHRGPIVYDIWQTGEPINRLNNLLRTGNYQNYDGWAIEYVGNVLKKEEAEKKYLIVLADGYPAASSYGGLSAKKHVRAVTDKLLRQGIHVVQIAIGGDIAEQEQMFRHFVTYSTISKTVKDFGKILDKAR